jgi:hypothetical protein
MMKELRRREAADHAPRMSIVYRAVDQLKLDPANARRHCKKQIRQIAESIKTFGFNVPILIDHDGKVVAGLGRLLACRLLGMTEMPTACLDHLTADQARAIEWLAEPEKERQPRRPILCLIAHRISSDSDAPDDAAT